MKLSSVRLTLFLLLLCGLALGNDLTLNPLSGELVVTGTPSLTRVNPTTLTNTQVSGRQLYLAVYDFNGPIKSCEISTGWTIQLLNGTTNYASVDVASATLTATALQGTFGAVQNGITSALGGYAPGYDFKVMAGNVQQCSAELGTSLDPRTGQFLKIVDQKPILVTPFKLLNGDPPIPIFLGSVQIFAPTGSSFSCPTAKTATLSGIGYVSNLYMGDGITIRPPVDFLNLTGAKDWRIIIYPQQVEIRPGKGKLSFSVSDPNLKLVCSQTGNSLSLDQGNLARTPQQIVVDFWPALTKLPRTVPIPCGGSNSGCSLLLKFKPPQ